VMSVRLRVINYFDAAAALLLGYDNFWVLDYSREKLFRWVRGEL